MISEEERTFNFLKNSDGFEGICFFGYYLISIEEAKLCYEKYKNTRINYLNIFRSFFEVGSSFNPGFSKSDMEIVKKFRNDKFLPKIMNSIQIENAVNKAYRAIPDHTSPFEDFYTIITPKEEKQSKSKSKNKFTYIIQGGNYYKIGVSNDLKYRLEQLNNSATPYKLEIVLIKDEDIEKELHEEFKNKNIGKEWFELDKKDLKKLKNKYKLKTYNHEYR